MTMGKSIPLIQLKPLESELMWHLAQGSTVKEASKTLTLTDAQCDYTLANLRRRFFARTNVQLIFLFAMIVKQEVRESIQDAPAQAEAQSG